MALGWRVQHLTVNYSRAENLNLTVGSLDRVANLETKGSGVIFLRNLKL